MWSCPQRAATEARILSAAREMVRGLGVPTPLRQVGGQAGRQADLSGSSSLVEARAWGGTSQVGGGGGLPVAG